MPTIRAGISKSRSDAYMASRGLVTETYDIKNARTSGIPPIGAASGQIIAGLAGFKAGDVVTNLVTNVVVTGTLLSFVKLALLDSNGVTLASTASVSATFNSGTGYKSAALTAPYTIPADGGYYIAFIQYGSGATGATLIQASQTAVGGTQLGSFPRAQAVVTAFAADITGTLVLADHGNAWWLGAS